MEMSIVDRIDADKDYSDIVVRIDEAEKFRLWHCGDGKAGFPVNEDLRAELNKLIEELKMRKGHTINRIKEEINT